MTLSHQQTDLFEFVKSHHGAQLRKYTHAPYWTHLLSVATIVSHYKSILGTEIAICHDLLEDTRCTREELDLHLDAIGYNPEEREIITADVQHLTDLFTHEAYPHLNRAERKKLESERLVTISANAQTVKYADIIDNSSSIVQFDPGFARVYLREIQFKIYRMDKGDPDLYKKCLETVEQAAARLDI